MGLSRAVEQITEEVYTAPLGSLGLFDELARTLVAEEGGPEWSLNICDVVLSHHFLNMLRGLAGVVERNCGDEMMADVRADDVVEEVGIDETEVTINGGCRTTSEGPGLVVVVRHGCVGVLEEGNCDCRSSLVLESLKGLC